MNRLYVSVSGGKTSAKMAWEIKRRYAGLYDMRFGFANTGKEREETLEFLNEMDLRWNLNLVWLEANVYQGERRATGHKIVTFKTASRDGEPFEEVIRKYGIPNKPFPHCTRELKKRTIESHIRSLGWNAGTYSLAIGIRADEPERCKWEPQFEYPLVHWFPMTKPEINDWWDEQPFNLRLREYEGNCDNCWKKSTKKLIRLAQERPESFAWWAHMEQQYSMAGPSGKPQVFFRGHLGAKEILKIAEASEVGMLFERSDENGGCSESCEAF